LHSFIPNISQNILRSEKQMSNEALLSNVIPFAGSGLLGYAMGFALKKTVKWMVVIIGFLAGMFFVGVQLLQKYGYVSTVNLDKLGNDTSIEMQHWAANVDITNVHSLFHTFGIPVSGGVEGHPIKKDVLYGKYEVLEGGEVQGVVILEFPTVADAKAYYDSPRYREAREHRFKAADYRGLIVEGVQPT
jgi:uncharacterized protein (DUF1330 family)